MSDSNPSPSRGTAKRNLPSWMSTKPDSTPNKKPANADEAETLKQAKPHSTKKHSNEETSEKSPAPNLGATSFSKLMDGVVFVLSGFVNPERGAIRSQAMGMGAEYQADWNSNCTLLVCAYSNTPKFRQVQADCGTIVSKEWIDECYNQKKLVDIDSYLMHAGKPWRKQRDSHEASQDQEPSSSRKSQKQVERAAHSKSTTSDSSKKTSHPVKDCFPPHKVKKWVKEDLSKTISWLESQEEKPEPSEIKKIAAQGILTCLQDTVDALKKQEHINEIMEQWNFIPRVVEELAKLEGTEGGRGSLLKQDLYKQAVTCKEIYELELDRLSLMKNNGSDACDSDETLEMTEEEIDQAYNTIASKLSDK